MAVILLPSKCLRSTMPVSYTHLDVYKRQQATQTANNGETVQEANGWPED